MILDMNSITCPKCLKTSWSKGDIESEFCLDCGYHADIKSTSYGTKKVTSLFQMSAWVNESWQLHPVITTLDSYSIQKAIRELFDEAKKVEVFEPDDEGKVKLKVTYISQSDKTEDFTLMWLTPVSAYLTRN